MWLGLAACGAGVLTIAFQFGFVAQVAAFVVFAAAGVFAGLRMRRPRQVVDAQRDGLIGRPATALVFRGRDGRVRLGDNDWPARTPPGVAPPDPGTRLRVARVDGHVLIVRPDL